MAVEIRPLRNETDYQAALDQIAALWAAQPGSAEADTLDVLATLVDAWESRHYPMDPPDPVEAIQFRMESQGLTRRDLEPMIGSRSRVSDVLNRKRGLSIEMIRRLHEGLGIPAHVLIQPTRPARLTA